MTLTWSSKDYPNGHNGASQPLIIPATVTSIVRQLLVTLYPRTAPPTTCQSDRTSFADSEVDRSSVENFVRETSLSTLPVEISFAIFDFLDRSDVLSLALTGPYYLKLFAVYFKHKYIINLLRGRREDLDILRTMSINTQAVQPSMIRFLCSNWEHAANVKVAEPVPKSTSRLPRWWSGAPTPRLHGDDAPVGYDTTHETNMRSIMWFWAVENLDIQGGIEVCYRCRAWMRICGYDGRLLKRMKVIRNRPV